MSFINLINIFKKVRTKCKINFPHCADIAKSREIQDIHGETERRRAKYKEDILYTKKHTEINNKYIYLHFPCWKSSISVRFYQKYYEYA